MMRSLLAVCFMVALLTLAGTVAQAAPVLGVSVIQAALPAAATGGAVSWQFSADLDAWADAGLVSDTDCGTKGLFIGASTGKPTAFLRTLPVLSWLPAGARIGAGWSAQSYSAMVYSALPLFAW
jgi:hypothetical protein